MRYEALLELQLLCFLPSEQETLNFVLHLRTVTFLVRAVALPA